MKMVVSLVTTLLLFLSSQIVIADPEMVFVKGGCFEMGDTFDEGEDDENPVHEICVNDFYIGKYEVTQTEWSKIMRRSQSDVNGSDNYPVENVSWEDIHNYIMKLNEKTGKKYRLPTEAEWEYAARSGGKKERWAGTSDVSELKDYAWYEDNSDRIVHPVGQKKPNVLGIHDMCGNVWEWVFDNYDGQYYESCPKDNPNGPLYGFYRVLRGGSWLDTPMDVRTADRGRCIPIDWFQNEGFRLVLPLN
jgi:formylglycine-generating enzyme required for sulfatase activity